MLPEGLARIVANEVSPAAVRRVDRDPPDWVIQPPSLVGPHSTLMRTASAAALEPSPHAGPTQAGRCRFTWSGSAGYAGRDGPFRQHRVDQVEVGGVCRIVEPGVQVPVTSDRAVA